MSKFDPKQRAEAKQRSREQDQRDLRMGGKSADDLRRENGRFSISGAIVRIDLAKRVS